MRETTTQTQTAWLSGDYVGANRPMVRATIQRLSLCLRSYGKQTFSSIPFGQANKPLELPNIKDVKWSRSVDGGVATLDMTLYNTAPLPLGELPQRGDFDQPGYYTFSRGNTVNSSRFHHTKNGWQDWIVPDRIIRTYEGYGFDATVAPEVDPHLYISGTWLIDDVEFTTDGLIKVSARDIGRALLDQILFPPVVPFAFYPLYFDKYHKVDNPDIVVPGTSSTSGVGWHHPTFSTSSTAPYIGVNGSEYGHTGFDAFDGSTATYWLSTGNSVPNAGYSYEYVEGKMASQTVAGVKFTVKGGPYTYYVSVYAGGKWQGDQTVPYDRYNPVSAPNGADVRYLSKGYVGREGTISVKLPKAVAGATRVRVAFGDLYNSGIGPYPYRAGVRDLQISGSVTVTKPPTTKDGGTHIEPFTSPPGYSDYTDVVKILLAYAGWYWPRETQAGFVTYSDGTQVDVHATTGDPVLTNAAGTAYALGSIGKGGNTVGRVWGDFEQTGTAGVVQLGVDVWDKKPVMDGINYVRDIVGFIFFIDETGGAVFRSPNIWSVGNYVGDGGPHAGRSSTVVEIDETKVLMSLGAKLSSRSIREKIFVGNISGQIAAMANGHNPYPSGLRRVGGWTDQHFASAAECQIMADLITLRQLFTYRTDKVTIPGNPAIQIDDQVRIYERISEEGFLHYVLGVSMNWSVETGKYTYELDTHWLGDATFSNWTFNPTDLSKEAQAYLKALGKI